MKVLLHVMIFVIANTAWAGSAPLTTVPELDLARYQGLWYEIGSMPQRFQRGCTYTTARYSIRPDGDVEVVNTCVRNGKTDSIKGKAWVPDPRYPGRLKVQFFWPFSGKYWVIELGQNYEYAVVGHPNRKYLWVLSRTPVMDDALYSQILQRAEEKGFDVSKVNKTVQAPAR